jgi:hypothetical protein
MKHSCGAALAVAATWFAVLAAPAIAEPASELLNSKVATAYVEPLDPKHRPIYERLKKRQVLEQLQQFLAPLRLPRTLTVKVEGCRGMVNAWYLDASVTLCYEYIDYIRRLAPTNTTAEGVTPEDAVVGSFVEVVLHELSHAVFDMLALPVLGREEDAADQLAAFIMLQFGKNVARRTLAGVAHLHGFEAATHMPSKDDFADTHGTPAQRFYNTLCMAYGGDPQTFGDYVDKGILPRHRANRCVSEYRQVARAFNKLLLPYVDLELMEKVRKVEWLRPEDGR